MSDAVWLIVVSYAVLAALLLVLCLRTNHAFVVKTGAILVVGLFYWLTYESAQGVLGWPAERELPERFMLLSSWITEPDKKTGDEGAIDLWAVAIGENGPAAKPRAYSFDYDKQLHRKLEEARLRINEGVIQVGRAELSDGRREPGQVSHFADTDQDITFEDLPTSELPEK